MEDQVNRTDEGEFRRYVQARMEAMRRIAFLLSRDWHTADDVVAVALGKLYRHWRKVRRADNVDAYVRAVLTRCWLDEQRRPWRREDVTAVPPEPAGPAGPGAEAVILDRAHLLDLLAQLPAGRRAVIVLRFYCDLSVEETAEILNVTEGTVKSQAARGLRALRRLADEMTDQLGVNTDASNLR